MDRIDLKRIYEAYGFKEEKGSIDVLVFSIRSGHYHNADIIPLKDNSNVDKVYEDYKSLGYASQIKKYLNTDQAKSELFEGFFNIKSSKKRFQKEYIEYTNSIVKAHSDEATYSFIKTGYYINGTYGKESVVEEIVSRLDDKKPILFLIEAAAGFGKTCSAYELLKTITDKFDNKLPIFSELSRNRQAKIFRYVLLDEIDRSFPLLSSNLVKTEIKSGKVPLILDGFDELLHDSKSESEKKYESTEPMLETISELLINSAKIILTTRRTAIFDGDEFHQWILDHENDFNIIRIKLEEPKIEDWLPEERLSLIINSGFPIKSLSNPVLLSFLRCISSEDFNEVVHNQHGLVEKYFESMLERERKRQDLLLTTEEQKKILQSICDDMILYDYTSESRDYLCSLILEKNQVEIEKSRRLYSSDVRPTTDELVNKLASHALLDKGAKDSQGIGFVNEFVLGNFCAENIISENNMEWAGEIRFAEPAIQSYLPRSSPDKEILWECLKFNIEFMDGYNKIRFNQLLTGSLHMDLDGDIVESLQLKDFQLGDLSEIKDTIFVNCIFTDVTLVADSFKNCSFINCSFYSCSIHGKACKENTIFLGCSSDNEIIIESEEKIIEHTTYQDKEIYVLEKFYPKGSPTFHKHRAIGAICTKNNRFTHHEILSAIEVLKRDELLIIPDKLSFLELNIEKISEVKKALGRDQ